MHQERKRTAEASTALYAASGMPDGIISARQPLAALSLKLLLQHTLISFFLSFLGQFPFLCKGFHGRYRILLASPNILGSSYQLSIRILSTLYRPVKPS